MINRCFFLHRINQELHSWVQDHYRKEENLDNSKSVRITDSSSISISTNPELATLTNSNEQQHVSRKVALLHRRTTKFVMNFLKIYQVFI